MGTISISQYTNAGSSSQHDQPALELNNSTRLLERTDTAVSANSLTLNGQTAFVSIHAVEKHRVATGNTFGASAAAQYDTVQANERRDFAVQPGTAIWFRTDA
jgi:hypothetical protein